MKNVRISVVLPIFNEEAIIQTTITDAVKKLDKLYIPYEILAIDDGSSDSTPHILDSLHKKYHYVRIISHPKNLGYGAVLRTGIAKAKYEWLFFTDADMQFHIGDIKDFLPFTKDYDFIVGYRKKRADRRRRLIISFLYNRLIRLLFDLQVRDVDCAFKLMKKSALKNIPFTSDSFFMSSEVMIRARKQKYKIKEIGVTHYPRAKG